MGVFYHHFRPDAASQPLARAASGCLRRRRNATAWPAVQPLLATASWTTTFLLMVICLPATFVWLSQDSCGFTCPPRRNPCSSRRRSTLRLIRPTPWATVRSPTSLTGGIGPWTTWLYLLRPGLHAGGAPSSGSLPRKDCAVRRVPLPERLVSREHPQLRPAALACVECLLLRIANAWAVPSLVGLWPFPMILLPPALATGLTPQQLEMVVPARTGSSQPPRQSLDCRAAGE